MASAASCGEAMQQILMRVLTETSSLSRSPSYVIPDLIRDIASSWGMAAWSGNRDKKAGSRIKSGMTT
jgi:hypothetical protein